MLVRLAICTDVLKDAFSVGCVESDAEISVEIHLERNFEKHASEAIDASAAGSA